MTIIYGFMSLDYGLGTMTATTYKTRAVSIVALVFETKNNKVIFYEKNLGPTTQNPNPMNT